MDKSCWFCGEIIRKHDEHYRFKAKEREFTFKVACPECFEMHDGLEEYDPYTCYVCTKDVELADHKFWYISDIENDKENPIKIYGKKCFDCMVDLVIEEVKEKIRVHYIDDDKEPKIMDEIIGYYYGFRSEREFETFLKKNIHELPRIKHVHINMKRSFPDTRIATIGYKEGRLIIFPENYDEIDEKIIWKILEHLLCEKIKLFNYIFIEEEKSCKGCKYFYMTEDELPESCDRKGNCT